MKKFSWNLGLLLYAFIVMLLCAGSSPLIQYLSPDSSIFYVMGRSMTRGLTLYRDVADHKGFYLFLFNGIGAFLTPNSMNGLFTVEVFFAFLKLFAVFKIAIIYLKSEKKAFLTSALFLAVSTNFLSWNTGNLAEQFALTFQLFSSYFIVRYFEESRICNKVVGHSSVYMYFHGLFAGIVLFIQANLIAMWIPFGIILAILLIKNKYFSNFLHNLGMLILGVLSATLPVLIYGLVNHCVEEMYYVMFQINFIYSAAGRGDQTIIQYLRDFILRPSVAIVILAFVGIYIAYKFYREKWIRSILFFMLLTSIICMSVSFNANPIYYTVYLPFILPVCIGLAGKCNCEKLFLLGCITLFGITILVNLQVIKKVFRIGSSGYTYESAYEMRNLIGNDKAEVLVLGESLYYNCTNTIPHIRYFTIFQGGMSYDKFPDCYDEQFQSLESLENEYVIVQYNNEDETIFSNISEMNKKMKEILNKDYHLEFKYDNGGVRAELYRKLNNESK